MRSEMTNIGLAIDWDFFVPACEWACEWGLHGEDPFSLEDAWHRYFNERKDMRTTGEETTFWDRVRSWADITADRITISESDALSYPYFVEEAPVDVIVLVDQHHDMFGSNLGAKLVGCHNWVRRWLINDRRHRLVWIKPHHSRFNMPTLGKVMRTQVSVVNGLEAFDNFDIPVDGDEFSITAVHACRSGCWTPPWTDAAFIDLVTGAGLRPVLDEWHPVVTYPVDSCALDIEDAVDPSEVREIPDGSRQIPRLQAARKH